MKSKIIFICMLLLISCSLSCVMAADSGNSTQDVDLAITENDEVVQDDNLALAENDNLTAGAGTFSELTGEVKQAEEDSTITLNKDYDGGESLSIILDKALTIDGNGHTIDCKNQKACFAFYASAGEITLKNLIIKNGNNDYFKTGGAILITGSAKLTIINCTFENNYAKNYGGAIYNGVKDGTLTINNTKFINNNAGGEDGGAIYTKGDLSIENSYFKSNTAKVDGGAIYSVKGVEATNCTFESNKATGARSHKCYGGAICAKEEIYLEDCQFSNNVADNCGGAVYGYDNVLVTGSEFEENSAKEGGAIYVDGPRAVVDKSTFTKNSATSGCGGAIYAYKWAHAGNSTFIANTATGKGGAIYADYIQFNVNGLFVNNTANGHGGAVYTNRIAYSSSNLNFENNYASSDYGGAIYINSKSGDAYFRNCNFTKNHANAGDGGAVYSDSDSTEIHLIGCVFRENYANGGREKRYGGAIRVCSILYIENSTFIGNWAENLGGAVYTPKLDYVKNSVFLSNYAKEGGAIYVNNRWTISVESSYFENNEAKDGHGGAIYTDSKDCHLTLLNNAFVSNKASKSGTDIYNSGTYYARSPNWWGMNDPTFNQRMMEWHTFSDSDLKDDNPVKMTLSGNSTGYTSINIPLTINFSHAVPGYVYDRITITSDKNDNFTGKTIVGNSLKFNLITDEPGTHKITVKLNSQTLTFDVAVSKNTVVGYDLVKYYGDNKTFSAVFFDAEGNPLVNGSPVTFQIGSEKYIGQVSRDGVATLDVNLEPGIYTVKSLNKLTGGFLTNKITVLSRNMTYNINDTFIMKFVSDESLDNTTVAFKLAGKTYQSNITKGIAYLRLDVAPGTYKFDIIYKNEVLSYNLTVLNNYSLVDLNIKGSNNYGTLMPIYSNENFTRVGNTMYSVIGENTYRYIMPDRTAFIVYNVTASNSDELTKVLKTISDPYLKVDVIIINLKPTTYTVKDNFWRDQEWYYLIHLTHGKLFINGNGATIDDGYHHNFLASNAGTGVVINNVTFKRFYRCFFNNGEIYCKDCRFTENNPKFWATATKGAVIHNKNKATFENCVIRENSNAEETEGDDAGKYLGVFYCDEQSLTTFIDCIVSENQNVRACENSMVVIYDRTYSSYNYIKNDGFFERGACLDLRGMDTLNSNKTKTLNDVSLDQFKKFVKEELINNVGGDASRFVINLQANKEYKLTENEIELITDHSSREWRTVYTKLWYTPVHERYLLDVGSRSVVINGHGSTISLTDHSDSHDYSFAYIPYKGSLTLVNLTLTGFNTALVNRGTLILINCTFKDNVIHHVSVSGDTGGAIRNFATVYCYNSTFTNNGANMGGAYYSKGSSANAVFYNCTFSGNVYKSNWAWKNNDPNAFYIDGESVVKLVNCSGVRTSDIKKDNDGMLFYRESLDNNIYTGEIDSVAALYKLSSMVSDNEEYDIFNITFVKGDYNLFADSKILFEMSYGTLILNGNGARIFVQNPKSNDETQFAVLSGQAFLFINGLTIEGFNIAIENDANLEIYNSIFSKNKVDYKYKDDYGGAIVNKKNLRVFNSTFIGNYAKYGGAIYNKGTAKFIICNYSDNYAYRHRSYVDIYTYEGSVESVVANSRTPKLTEEFPMPAWKYDLIETSINLIITIASGAVGYQFGALEYTGAHLVADAIGMIIGGVGGAINGFIYSADREDYSEFWSKVLEGVNVGLDAATYGEAVQEIVNNEDHKIAPIADDDLYEAGMDLLYDEFISRTVELGQSFIDAYAEDENYDSVGLYWFFKNMGG